MQGRKLDQILDDQFATGRLFAAISSRPGQARMFGSGWSYCLRRACSAPHPKWCQRTRLSGACFPARHHRPGRQDRQPPHPRPRCPAFADLASPQPPPTTRLQCGRADGYILEGRELEFYVKKMAKKKVGAGELGPSGWRASWRQVSSCAHHAAVADTRQCLIELLPVHPPAPLCRARLPRKAPPGEAAKSRVPLAG